MKKDTLRKEILKLSRESQETLERLLGDYINEHN